MSLFRNLLIEKKRRKYYCEVEYLESTGTQYIDTRYKMVAGKTMTFNSNIMWTQSNGNANFFYGYRSVNSAEYRGDMRAFFVYGASAPPAGRLAIRYGVNTDNSTSVISPNRKYNISFDGTNLKVDGSTFIYLSEAYTPAVYKSMWLFNCNCTGYYSSDVSTFSGRIYNWQIFEDGVLVRDLIPVLGWDGKGYMYDKVSGQLFGNAGTGDFVVGRQIHPVEYLESTGEQYIDTKYIPNANTECSMNLAFVSLDSTYRTPFSVRTADGATNSFTIMSVNSQQTNNSFAFGSYYWSGPSVPSVVLNKTVKAVLRKGYASWDGVSGNPGTSITPTTLTAYMFARNANGTVSNFFIGRIYDCQLKENGTLVRDYIPAIDSSGTPFMFDRVSHTCFLNQGTGKFSYPAREVEYLEADGNQFIKTGIVPNNSTGAYGVFNLNNITNNNYLLGSRGSQAGVGRFYLYNNENSTNVRYGWGSLNTTNADAIISTKVSVSLNYKNDKKYIYNNSILVQSLADVSWSSNTYQMYLFSTNFADNDATSIGAGINGKIYEAKITDGSDIVRDFIPCYKDGVACMVDKLTGTAYTNQGTGSFSVGRIVEPEYE